MAALIPAVAAELARGIDDVLEQGAAVATGNQGEYIRGGTPSSIYGKVQQAGARQACRRYADDPTKFQGRASVLAEKACRPYLDDIGYGSPPTIKKPFSGGQCAGASYRATGDIFFTVINCSTGAVSQQTEGVTTEFIFTGPVTSVTPRTFGGGPCGDRQLIFDITDANGTSGYFFVTRAAFNVRITNARFEGSFEPAPGSSNDCGSPPPDITDPTPPLVPGPRFEPFSPSPDIDIDIGVEVNIDGSIDIDFGTGPITINPFGDEDGGGPGIDPTPTDPGSPGATGSTGSGGETEGEAPEGQELVGVLVTVIDTPPLPNTFGRTVETVYRGVGYIRMGFAGRLGVDVSGGTVFPTQFFHAQQRGLTSYKVSANLGYNLSVTPYYRDTNL